MFHVRQQAAPLYWFETRQTSEYCQLFTLRLLGGKLTEHQRKTERRINEFSDRTGLSLSQIQIVKMSDGTWRPIWNGAVNQDGELRTSGNPARRNRD